MTLGDLADNRQGMLGADDAGWPDRVAALAENLRAELAGGASLRDAGDRIRQVAGEVGMQAVTGASRLGDQLAGAVVAVSNGGLHLATSADTDVLVVDGLLATGSQIEHAVRRLRAAGAERVVGVALVADREALEMCRSRTGAEVVALETV